MTNRKKTTVHRPHTTSNGFVVQLESDSDSESYSNYYQALIENFDDLVVIIDSNWSIKYTSRSSNNVLGCKPESLVGKNIDGISQIEDMDGLKTELKHLINKKNYRMKYELRVCVNGRAWNTFEVTGINLLHNPSVEGIVLHFYDITERKQREDELKQQEERYRLLADNVTDVIFTTDMNLKFTYFSPSVTRSRGYTPEEAMNLGINKTMTPESVDTCMKVFTEELALERQEEKDINRTRIMELEMLRKDGTAFWAEVKLSFMRDKDGNPLGIVGISRNIDERKQAERALLQSEEKFRMMFELSPEAILLVDKRGNIIDGNDRLLVFLGYKPEDEFRKNLFDYDFFTDESKEKALDNFKRRMNGEEIRPYELTLISKNGDIRYGLVNAKTIQGKGESDIYDLIMISDITGLKKVEEAYIRRTQEIITLQKITTSIQSTLELREVLQLISEAVVASLGFDHVLLFLSDEEMTVTRGTVFYSSGGSKLVSEVEDTLKQALSSIEIPLIRGYSNVVDNGLDKKETVVHQLYEIAQPPFSRDECDYVQMLLGANTVINVPFYMKDKHVGNILAFTSKGNISEEEIEILWLLADHTAIAIENARLNENLERRITERTTQLQAANTELERFAYSVAHDLRTPLRGIDGFSQVLLEDYSKALDSEGKGYLERVRSASQKMSLLIDDILHLLHLTRSEMHVKSVDLSALAQKIFIQLNKRQPEREIEFVIAPKVIVQGDAQLLKEALLELLNNAWKFSSKKTSAKIEFGYTEINGRTTYFVRDDGAGFDMHYVDKLFTAFQRLHSISEFEGNGIGLAKVQRIIYRHGGKIWAESTVGYGATFYFTLWSEGSMKTPEKNCKV